MLIKHVLSDATEDHVQELAAMEAVPLLVIHSSA